MARGNAGLGVSEKGVEQLESVRLHFSLLFVVSTDGDNLPRIGMRKGPSASVQRCKTASPEHGQPGFIAIPPKKSAETQDGTGAFAGQPLLHFFPVQRMKREVRADGHAVGRKILSGHQDGGRTVAVGDADEGMFGNQDGDKTGGALKKLE